MKNQTCPICEEGQLHSRSEPMTVEHLGQQGKNQTSWQNVAVVNFSSPSRKARVVASHELERETCYA